MRRRAVSVARPHLAYNVLHVSFVSDYTAGITNSEAVVFLVMRPSTIVHIQKLETLSFCKTRNINNRT